MNRNDARLFVDVAETLGFRVRRARHGGRRAAGAGCVRSRGPLDDPSVFPGLAGNGRRGYRQDFGEQRIRFDRNLDPLEREELVVGDEVVDPLQLGQVEVVLERQRGQGLARLDIDLKRERLKKSRPQKA